MRVVFTRTYACIANTANTKFSFCSCPTRYPVDLPLKSVERLFRCAGPGHTRRMLLLPVFDPFRVLADSCRI